MSWVRPLQVAVPSPSSSPPPVLANLLRVEEVVAALVDEGNLHRSPSPGPQGQEAGETPHAHGAGKPRGGAKAGMALLRAVLEDLLSQKILYLRLVSQHLVIGGAQELRPAIAQLLPDILLHAGIVELALP